MTDDHPEESATVGVTLRPSALSVRAGGETTVELVVTGADSGVSAYESAVHLDGDGARITYLELTGDPAVPLADIVDDDTTAVLAAAMGPDSDHDPGDDVVIAELTVTGDTAGASASLSVDEGTEVAPISDGIDRYTVGDYGTATLTVREGDDA